MLAAALAGTPAAVAVGADRHEAGSTSLAAAAAAGAPLRCALLDDGLQHWALARQLEVVAVNALTLWGNGRRVPAGPLRETPAAALRRAHVVVAHNWPLATPAQRAACDAALDALCPRGALRLRSHLAPAPFLRALAPGAPPQPLAALAGAPVLCLAAVGCPAAVAATLAACGAAPVRTLAFPDHHAWSMAELAAAADATDALSRHCGRAAWLVTTAKDAARCEGALRTGLARLGGRALVMEGRIRIVDARGAAEDARGAAALDAALAAVLAVRV
jgi:tetraacyldisaccharide 4'-kinase